MRTRDAVAYHSYNSKTPTGSCKMGTQSNTTRHMFTHQILSKFKPAKHGAKPRGHEDGTALLAVLYNAAFTIVCSPANRNETREVVAFGFASESWKNQ